MRRLPTRINLEGPESRRYALRPKRYVISASGRPFLNGIVFTAEALNMDARYGADGRTCFRATMSHPPSSIPLRSTPTSTRRTFCAADAVDAVPQNFTPHSSSSFRPRRGRSKARWAMGRSRFAGERRVGFPKFLPRLLGHIHSVALGSGAADNFMFASALPCSALGQ